MRNRAGKSKPNLRRRPQCSTSLEQAPIPTSWPIFSSMARVGVSMAFASGLGLRELARNMGLSENTVLARARREKWTHQILIAKQQGKALHSNALAPMHSAGLTMQQRAERYTERMAGVSERVLPHLETLPPATILDSARNLEQLDRVARRNFGLDTQPAGGGILNLDILCNQSLIQVVNKT